jgi:autotransporter-associated beta strand protein
MRFPAAADNSQSLSFTATGAMGFSGPTGARTLTLTGTNTAANLLAAAIGDNGGATSLTKSGIGTWVLSGTNNFTGVTSVSAGTLRGGAPNTFSSGSAHTVAASALLHLNNLNQAVGSLAGAGSVTLGTGTLDAGGSNASTTFSGAISGSGGLTKSGSGTFTLSGSGNDYSGATSVSAGTLLVNGQITGVGSNVAVANIATLGGGGSIARTIDVNSGGTVTGGDFHTVGNLTATAQNWNGGGIYVWDIANTATAVNPGDNYDLLTLSGALTINADSGNKFKVKIASSANLPSFDKNVNYVWTVVQAGSITNFNVDRFDLITSDFTDDHPTTDGSFSMEKTGNNLSIRYTAVPEPGTVSVLAGVAGMSLLPRGRRARAS